MITVVEVVTVVVEVGKALLETIPRITRGGTAVMEKQGEAKIEENDLEELKTVGGGIRREKEEEKPKSRRRSEV